MQIITEQQLRKQVPSIFSTQAHSKTTEKYALIPTIECILGLQKAGFFPVKAQESRCRSEDNKPFAKHLIRFRRQEMVQVGGNVPEIVMINSHNGTSSYQLRAGIYRLVCSNGLIVGNETFYRSVRHQGDVISKIVGAASELIEIIPEVIDTAQAWKGIALTPEQRRIYAESAALLKWDTAEVILPTEKLLLPNRFEDKSTDLWTTFNSVQENIIRGGVRVRNRATGDQRKSREVNSVSENSRLNTALWNLTERMATLTK